VLKIENLSVHYPASDEALVLKNISLSLGDGERLAIIGANGAGKSTLLTAICGFLEAETGSIEIDGTRLTKNNLALARRAAGFVFQNSDDQLFMPKVYDDIAFGPRNLGAAEAEIEADANALLEKLGIGRLRERFSHKLSGGEKKLVCLASVLIMKPSLLLLDEPSAFLDPRGRRNIIKILDGLEQSMLISTHDLPLATTLCPRAVLLKDGVIFADGKTAELLSDAALLEAAGL
jgi:cobalt/nickel transport system ATP-binding protein